MSRIDRYDIDIRPVLAQHDADASKTIIKIVEAVRSWTNLELHHDLIAYSNALACWGERQCAAGESWDDAHEALVAAVHKVAPRTTISSRWWDGEREPDDQFTTAGREKPKSVRRPRLK